MTDITNLIVHRAGLQRILGLCAEITDGHGSNVEINVEGSTLHLLATNGETWVHGRVDGDGSGPRHPFTLNVRDLAEVVEALPHGSIGIARVDADRRVHLRSVGSPAAFSIPTYDGDGVAAAPVLPQNAHEAEIRTSVLRYLFRHARHAMSKDESRPHINALLIEWGQDQLRAVSTDGHRLAIATAAITADLGPRPESIGKLDRWLLLPAETVHMFASLLDDAGATVRVRRTAQHVAFVFPHITVTVAHRKADYPNWRQVVPSLKAQIGTITVRRHRFREALARVTLSDRTREHHGGAVLRYVDDTITITSESPAATGFDAMPAEGKFGGTTATWRQGFDGRYLIDACDALEETQDLVLRPGVEELDPIVIEGAPIDGHEGYTATMIIMPRRI